MATTSLVCKQCNFENEPERVYCHNCGAKLDRSVLPPEATKRADPVVIQERVRKMVKPKRGSGSTLRNLLSSLSLAVLLAVLVVMAKSPGDVPVVSKDASLSAPTITDDMDGLVAQTSPAQLGYTEEQVNAFLQTTIHGKRDESSGMVPLKFERAYVHFDEGLVRITYVQSVFGWPIYSTVAESVAIANGQVTGKPVSSTIGRLPIPAQALPYTTNLFAALWKVLERDKNVIAKMGSITFHKPLNSATPGVVMRNKAAAGVP